MDLLDGLNPAQAQAVTHRGTPLVVLAGPGTGKTRVIAHRVAHLILQDGVKPEQIVALTFTVKAAEQMRERIGTLLRSAGPQQARLASAVNIHTYHGLGHRLVRRFADRLGYGASPTLIDSAQHKRVLREVIRGDKRAVDGLGEGVGPAAERVMKISAKLGDYAINPEAFGNWCRQWGERLERNEQGLEREVLAGKKAEQRMLSWAAGVYRAATVELRRRGWLTFNDLLTEPLRLLNSDTLARDLVRGEFRHALVDEFQDVNQATILLLRALFPPERNPDLCVVGDDDQAIYAFRGADDRAFAKFALGWPNYTQVRLEANYRSAPAVVELANRVMERAEERFDAEKKVVAANPQRASLPGAGTLAVKIPHHGDWLGPAVATVLDERRRYPDRPWRQTAVIARGHGSLAQAAAALEAEGVPVQRRKPASPLEDAGVQDLIAWARLLVDPRDTESGRRLLLRPPVAFSGPRVIHLLEAYASVAALAKEGEGEDPGAFLPWVAARLPAEAPLAAMAALYAEFRQRLPGEGAGRLLFDLALRTDAVHTDLLTGRARAGRLRAVVSLLRFALEREERLEQPRDLRAFLEYFDDLNDSEQEALDNSVRVDGEDGEQPEDQESDGGVQLLTAHAAKGLEFDTVLVIRTNPMKGGFPMPQADDGLLPDELLAEQGTVGDFKMRAAAEERRLFYVASTRAERRLVLLGDVPKGKTSSTHFVVELLSPISGKPIESVTGEDHVRQIGLGAGDPLRVELAAGKSVRDRQSVVDELSTRARIEAAAALGRAATANLTREGLAQALAELESAARHLSVLAHAHATAKAPDWSDRDDERVLVQAVASATPPPRAGERIDLRPPQPPLRLSFTQIKEYLRCPACWYLKHHLKLVTPSSRQSDIGTVVHAALCDFYARWAEADAASRPHPPVEELEAIGRTKYLADAAARSVPIDADELARLRAMLRTAHTTLHGRDGHPVQIIEKPELSLRFPFGEHTIEAKIDRLERRADGGVRIVDYKTGQDWKSLTEPDDDDLQMGIYAMAIDHHFGGEVTLGVAEYWLLASGQVGSIKLDALNRRKISGKIQRAIDGMLAGEYAPDKKCKNGLCRLITPGVVVDP